MILWRDIPAQVNGRWNDVRHQVELPRRFQRSIDEAAMVAGKKTANEYVVEWRRDTTSFEGESVDEMRAVVDALVAGFEAEFPKDHLDEYVTNGGFKP